MISSLSGIDFRPPGLEQWIAAAAEAKDIEFSSVFNVAEIFIDRHIKEGRKDKVAIYSPDGIEVTYRELFENVNKSGNLLKRLGLKKGDRILMMVKDSPEFFYLFWGAIKAGIIPVPINTLLRTKDYFFIILPHPK